MCNTLARRSSRRASFFLAQRVACVNATFQRRERFYHLSREVISNNQSGRGQQCFSDLHRIKRSALTQLIAAEEKAEVQDGSDIIDILCGGRAKTTDQHIVAPGCTLRSWEGVCSAIVNNLNTGSGDK